MENKKTIAVFAVILSLFIPGLGQLVNGQVTKGIVFLILDFVAWLTFILFIGYLLWAILWVISMIDAVVTAVRTT
jgi:TM2 domain-containing membrane protein YozV